MRVRKTTYGNLYTRGIKKLFKDKRFDSISKVRDIIKKLENFEITSSNDNHPLTGDYRGYKDIHVEDDLVLIYNYSDAGLNLVDLKLANLGNHDEVFPKNKQARKTIKNSLKNL